MFGCRRWCSSCSRSPSRRTTSSRQRSKSIIKRHHDTRIVCSHSSNIWYINTTVYHLDRYTCFISANYLRISIRGFWSKQLHWSHLLIFWTIVGLVYSDTKVFLMKSEGSNRAKVLFCVDRIRHFCAIVKAWSLSMSTPFITFALEKKILHILHLFAPNRKRRTFAKITTSLERNFKHKLVSSQRRS